MKKFHTIVQFVHNLYSSDFSTLDLEKTPTSDVKNIYSGSVNFELELVMFNKGELSIHPNLKRA